MLTAIVAIYDETGRTVSLAEVMDHTGFDKATATSALKALGYADEQRPYFYQGIKGTYDGDIYAGPPTQYARRAVGAWPTADGLADQLVEALNQAANQVDDPEQGSCLRRTANFLAGAGRDIGVEVFARIVGQQIGM